MSKKKPLRVRVRLEFRNGDSGFLMHRESGFFEIENDKITPAAVKAFHESIEHVRAWPVHHDGKAHLD